LISPWRSADTKIDNHQVEANNLNDVYEIQNLEGKEKLTCAAIMSYMRDFTGEGPL
jgi:hypothetical protein